MTESTGDDKVLDALMVKPIGFMISGTFCGGLAGCIAARSVDPVWQSNNLDTLRIALGLILGAGFGSVTGAVIGCTSAIVAAIRGRGMTQEKRSEAGKPTGRDSLFA